MEDIGLRATMEQLRSFLGSPVWADMKEEVMTWLNDIRNQLEETTNIEISRRLQGNAEACRYFLSLPDSLIEAMENTYGRTDGSGTVRDNE